MTGGLTSLFRAPAPTTPETPMPASPAVGLPCAHDPALTAREQAAIALRQPNSGNPEIDAMIVRAKTDELAAMAMQASIMTGYYRGDRERLASDAYKVAATMLSVAGRQSGDAP